MRHIRFKMKGNKHLALRGIDTVTMEPHERLQIILGTNGSGKSTLMRELSPLHSDHSHFHRGGYKSGEIEKNGSIYEYISDFTTDKNHYKLTKDGKVIYEGHVASAYQEYVKELGITPEVHELSIGKIRFTEMDTAEKRNWITKLSPVDYSYAIGYYKRLTESQRDITGAIKRLNDKLIQEKSRLLDDQEQKRLLDNSNKLKETKQRLLIEWRPMDITFDDALHEVDRIDSELLELSHQFKKCISIYCGEEGFQSENQIHQAIGETKAKMVYIDNELESIFKELDDNSTLLRQTVAVGDQDVQTIDLKVSELSSEKDRLKSLKHFDHVYLDPQTSKSILSANFSEIVRLLNELIPDPDDTITIASTQSLKQSIVEYENIKNKNINDIQVNKEIVSAMNHRKTQGHTECPKCKFVWFKGYDEAELIKAQKNIESLENTNDAIDKNIERISQIIETNLHEIQIYQQIVYLCKTTNSHLFHMWDLVMANKLFKTDRAKAIQIVHQAQDDLDTDIQMSYIQDKIDELLKLRQSAITTSIHSRDELISKNTKLEYTLFHKNHEKRQLGIWLKRLEDIKQVLAFQSRYEDTTSVLLSKREETLKKAEVLNEQSLISTILANLDKDITDIERELGKCMSQVALVKSYEEQIAELTEKEKLLKLSIKALSPTEGLIAQGLTGFINHFIAQMNAVIEKVWLHPLAICPIELTEETALKLDYKFAFTVEGKKAGKDVKDGSGAQKEIFDLAFMLVSMKHLKLDDYPIFLDEFSIKMDYAHRKEAMRMIMDLLNSSSFSQVFMVSHYENSYGSISNADITVLCAENIEIPSDLVYNKHSSIER